MKNLTILAFHRVFPRERGTISVTTEMFEQQIRWFLDHGYQVMTLKQVYDSYLSKGCPIDKKTLVITFDDGYRDNHMYAFPILKKLNVPAVVFLTAQYIGTTQFFPWEQKELPGISLTNEDLPLTWKEVKELVNAGWEMGSHSLTHPDLIFMDDAGIHHELKRSKELIEQNLGIPITSFCGPRGYIDERVITSTEAAGYQIGVVNPPWGGIPETRFSLKRVGVYQHDTLLKLRLKISPVFQWWRELRSKQPVPREHT